MLEKLPKDDLLALARKFHEHKVATQYAKGDLYLKNAHEKQLEFHRAQNRVRIFFGGNRCLAEGTLVATPEGPRAIELMRPGDCVYSEHGKPIKVLQVWNNGVKEVADVVGAGGEVLASCTANHSWLATCGEDVRRTPSFVLNRNRLIVRVHFREKLSTKEFVAVSWGANKRQENTWDISVGSETNLYCLANGLVTHNSGKTTAGTNETRWILEGTHPYRKSRLPVKGCIVCQDFQTHAKDIIIPKIREWFPPGLIVKEEKNQSGVEVKFICKNGSVLDVKSHEQDIKVFEGSDYDFIWFDEPPPEAIFKALWRGLTDRRGSAVFTGTPLTEPWLFDLYQKAASEHNKGLYWSVFASIHENAKNIGEGDVTEGQARIKEFLDALDPDEREAREKGHFLHMRGLIFKGWDRKTHLIPPFKWPSKWPIYISLDPHPRKPWALSFLGVSPGGFRFLIASYQVEGVVEDVAQHILWAKNEIPLDSPGAPRIQSCWIDNYASVESMIKKSTTIIEELNRLVSPSIPRFRPAPKNVDEKISIFKSWLKVQETKYGKRPGFMAFDTPENRDFIYEIEHYVWASQRGARRNQLKNVPVKENDDILDTIMQLALVLDSRRRQDASDDQPKIIKYAGR